MESLILFQLISWVITVVRESLKKLARREVISDEGGGGGMNVGIGL